MIHRAAAGDLGPFHTGKEMARIFPLSSLVIIPKGTHGLSEPVECLAQIITRFLEGRPLDTGRLVAGLEAAGWRLFENRRDTLPTAAGPVDVAGLGDPHIGLDAPERLDWTPPATPVALRLGVVHAPYTRALDVFDCHGFDLAVAGHTHGGQVRLPGVGALVANCDLPLRQARGVSRYGADLWLHVSAGAGQSLYAPFRFACRPEATLLDLVPA
jgi:uncharacterized protein